MVIEMNNDQEALASGAWSHSHAADSTAIQSTHHRRLFTFGDEAPVIVPLD